jgi:mediator of RNA polymerase II transcription subunit 21
VPTAPHEPKATDPLVRPPDAARFRSDLGELARDLVVKSKQVELLIDSLPGAGFSEQDQMARVKQLEEELVAAENERQQVLVESAQLLGKCDDLILKVSSATSEIRRST